jgi:hypothetical protein
MQHVLPCCSLPRFPHTTAPILCACRSTSRQALRGPWDASAPHTLWTRREHGTLWTRCEHGTLWTRTCERPCRLDKPHTFVASLRACIATIRMLALAQPCFVLRKRRAMPCACNWVPRVMDGCAVSRDLCITHGNPVLQPSYFAMVNTASPTHASLRS